MVNFFIAVIGKLFITGSCCAFIILYSLCYLQHTIFSLSKALPGPGQSFTVKAIGWQLLNICVLGDQSWARHCERCHEMVLKELINYLWCNPKSQWLQIIKIFINSHSLWGSGTEGYLASGSSSEPCMGLPSRCQLGATVNWGWRGLEDLLLRWEKSLGVLQFLSFILWEVTHAIIDRP
jgi:hypothetical protein